MATFGSSETNIFKPSGRSMRRQILVIAMVLAGWLAAIAGSQGIVYLLGHSRQGEAISQWTFFNLPIPFWLTGQFLPLWFIVLCVVFNIWMDRHDAHDRASAFRFRTRTTAGWEE
jgi:putative solute:sodium symporter small subunit